MGVEGSLGERDEGGEGGESSGEGWRANSVRVLWEGRGWEIRVRVLAREKRLNWRRIHGVPEFAETVEHCKD